MNLELQYRDATMEDAELLTATAVSSKKTWGYSDALIELWKTDLEITRDYIPQNKVVKVFIQERFIGFFAIENKKNGHAEIEHLWLTPNSIRQNYGRRIFQHIIAYLSANGYQKATLTAEPNAIGFYEKMGGKIIGKFESKISGRFLDQYEFETNNAIN